MLWTVYLSITLPSVIAAISAYEKETHTCRLRIVTPVRFRKFRRILRLFNL